VTCDYRTAEKEPWGFGEDIETRGLILQVVLRREPRNFREAHVLGPDGIVRQWKSERPGSNIDGFSGGMRPDRRRQQRWLARAM